MSHVDDIGLEIADTPQSLDALEACAKELGGVLVRGKKTYAWYGHHVGDHPLPAGFTEDMLGKCEHVIQLPGCKYEIGICRHPTKPGKFTPLYDHWGQGQKLVKAFGKGLEKIKQFYGLNHSQMQLKAKGISTQRIQQKNGITLRIFHK